MNRLLIAIAGLVLLMLPLWPVDGTWFGLPAWIVLAVLSSACASVFTAWWAMTRWPESEEPEIDA